MRKRYDNLHQQDDHDQLYTFSNEQLRQCEIFDEENDDENKQISLMQNLLKENTSSDSKSKFPTFLSSEQQEQHLQFIRISSQPLIQNQQNSAQREKGPLEYFYEENSSPISRRQSKSSSKKSTKNQYDKNIFGNISHIFIRKMLSGEYMEEINRYCRIQNLSLEEFLQFFDKTGMKNMRIGVTQLHNFFNSKSTKQKIKKIFKRGVFSICNFRRQDDLQIEVPSIRHQDDVYSEVDES